MARGGSWFKVGALGCLGFGGLVLATVLVASAIAFLSAPPEQVEDHVLNPEIPAGAGGRVVLEIREAELHVEPVEPGEPLRVEARYDVNSFALEEEVDSGADGDGAWSYRATFGRSDRAGAFAGLVSLARGSAARIDVFLPADVPMDLVLDVEDGAAVVRLGGLWLNTAVIGVESGALDLDVNRPLREPMEHLAIRTAGGGSLLNHLGNASPRRLDVRYGLGHIDMDLGGHWLVDAEIHINGGMGGGVVHLPAGVILEGLDLGEIKANVAPELNPPTLKFSVSTGMGYLEWSDIRLRDVPALD